MAAGGQRAVSCHLTAHSQDRFARMRELAEPKKAACANYPRLMWGNQETIWSVSRGVRKVPAFPRTMALAKPKRGCDKHRCSYGQKSTIGKHPPLVDFCFPSDRLLKLAEPKKYQAAYLQQRPLQSPQWPVSSTALNYRASPRILELAYPKALHSEYVMAREVPTRVPDAAGMVKARSRLELLAEPIIRKVTHSYEHSFLDTVIRPVSKTAQQAIASSRTLELARAKRLHPDYVPSKDAEWVVVKSTQRAVATPRLIELAQPCKRSPMNLTQFNPDVFTVRESAKKAICSARIQELACPRKR